METPRTTEPSAPDTGSPEYAGSHEAAEDTVGVYSIDSVEAWREAQLARWHAYDRNESYDFETKKQLFVATLNDSVDAYLQGQGVTPDDDNYDALRDLYRQSDIFAVHNNDWDISPAFRGRSDDEAEPSPRDKVIAALRALRSPDESPDDTPTDNLDDEPDAPDTPEDEQVNEHAERLQAAMEAYARETAKSRQGYFHHVFGGKALTAAKEAYDEARVDYLKAAGDITLAQLTHETVRVRQELEDRIAECRKEVSAKPNRFTNWWVRRKGVGGKIIKGAVIAGTGVVIGSLSALMLPVVGAAAAGLAAGGAAGFGIAHHVTKRRAKSLVDKDDTELTLADEEAVLHGNLLKEQMDDVREADEEKGTADNIASESEIRDMVQHNSKDVEARTAETIRGNRRRVIGGAILGAAGGVVGAGVTADILSALRHGLHPTPDVSSLYKTDISHTDALTRHIVANPNITINPGDGLENILQQLRPDLSGGDIHNLHESLLDKYGQNYLDIKGVSPDTYLSGGDVRLTQPGIGQFVDGVMHDIGRWR